MKTLKLRFSCCSKITLFVFEQLFCHFEQLFRHFEQLFRHFEQLFRHLVSGAILLQLLKTYAKKIKVILKQACVILQISCYKYPHLLILIWELRFSLKRCRGNIMKGVDFQTGKLDNPTAILGIKDSL